MKSPLARLPAPRRCRTRLVLWLACSALAAVPVAAGAADAPTGPHTYSDTPGGGAVSPEVAAAQKRVADLESQLHALEVQMQNLNAAEPQNPGPTATQAERKKYKQDHVKWEAQVDKLRHQIDSVWRALTQAKKDLDAAKRKAAGGA